MKNNKQKLLEPDVDGDIKVCETLLKKMQKDERIKIMNQSGGVFLGDDYYSETKAIKNTLLFLSSIGKFQSV